MYACIVRCVYMYAYVYMYVHVCVVCTCARVCMCVMFVYVCRCVCTCAHVRVHAHMRSVAVCARVCACVHVRVCMYVRACLWILSLHCSVRTTAGTCSGYTGSCLVVMVAVPALLGGPWLLGTGVNGRCPAQQWGSSPCPVPTRAPAPRDQAPCPSQRHGG